MRRPPVRDARRRPPQVERVAFIKAAATADPDHRTADVAPTRGTDLDRAARLVRAGWWDLNNAIAHLVAGYRTTCGRAAPLWVRERIADHVAAFDDDELDRLAAELELEAVVTAAQLRELDERRGTRYCECCRQRVPS